MARAKEAHDAVLSAVYRAQGDALLIEARAKVRLADEYDAAQEPGEVAGDGRSKVEPDNVTTAADLGLRRDESRTRPPSAWIVTRREQSRADD